MQHVHVITPGLFTTVQDLGRVGYQRFGVPVAGVFDTVSAQVANWLVGNKGDAAVLEITFAGPTLRTEVTLQAAITGGQLQATLDGKPVPMWQSFTWQAGQTLAIGNITAGARAYLAVSGEGWQVPVVMDSRSTYVRAAIGGLEGRQLQAGDQLPVSSEHPPYTHRYLPQAFWPIVADEICLRFVPGPQTDHFEPDAVEKLCASTYTVSQASDRMGLRLQGPSIVPLKPDIISDAIALGSMQVPRDGQPIVMGPDRQTTGGYPKIGTVITADIVRLAQARPGTKITWQAVTVAEAQELAKAYVDQLYRMQQVINKEIAGRSFQVQIGDKVLHSFVERLH
ncbi:MAG: biotin-dependent carboxyltransferase family protein [Firmicutes bacterium]|nr:biotin-dependent carboxyltransferase family protein [Bacillota bacterium]